MSTLVHRLDRMEVSILLDAMKCLDQRNRMIEAPPLTRVPVPHHIESIGSNVIQTGERMLELRLDCIGRVRAEPFNETIATAMPFPTKVYGIIEFRRTDRGKKARLQDFGYEFVAGSNDRCLFTLRWEYANVLRRPNPLSPSHGAPLQNGS
ncbi:MAG: hypothetical protein ABSD08_17005 [Xanthobacteraceae bacterium]